MNARSLRNKMNHFEIIMGHYNYFGKVDKKTWGKVTYITLYVREGGVGVFVKNQLIFDIDNEERGKCLLLFYIWAITFTKIFWSANINNKTCFSHFDFHINTLNVWRYLHCK